MKDVLLPWGPIASEQQRESLEQELSREIGPGHVLAGKTLHALARRGDRDDILVEATGLGYAVVHLTWSGTRETSARRPRTELFSSIDEWKAKGMKRDHEDSETGA